MKTVELNIPLLDAEIKAHRMKQGEFSELIGKSGSYISYVKSTGSKIPKNVESLICKMLDKPDGYFVKSPEQPSGRGGIQRSEDSGEYRFEAGQDSERDRGDQRSTG